MGSPLASLAAWALAAAYMVLLRPPSLLSSLAVMLASLVTLLECHILSPPAPTFDLGKIPSPPAHRWLGHMRSLKQGAFHDVLRGWADEYGGIYHIWLPGKKWVIVSDPVVAARAFNKGDDYIYQRTPNYALFDKAMGAAHGLSSSFGTTDEEHWRNVRKSTSKGFSVENLRLIYGKNAAIFDRLLDAASEEQAANGSVQLEHLLLQAQAHATVQTLFQCDWEGTLKAKYPTLIHDVLFVLEDLHHQLKNPMHHAWVWSPLSWLLSQPSRDFHAAMARMHAFYLDIAEDIRSRPDPDESDSSLSACLWRLADPATGKLFTAKELVPQVGLYFIAAFETSSSTIGFLSYCAAVYPHHQTDLYNELKSAGFAGPSAKPLGYDDLTRLPKAGAFINECMRRYPATSTSGSRLTLKPTKVGPYVVPAGVSVICMIHAVQNSKANWGSDALEFKPERWAEPDAHLAKGSKDALRFIPFQIGPKNCVGQSFGLMIVRGIFLRLVSRFDIALHASMPPVEQLNSITLVALTTKLTRLQLVLKERH